MTEGTHQLALKKHNSISIKLCGSASLIIPLIYTDAINSFSTIYCGLQTPLYYISIITPCAMFVLNDSAGKPIT
jgi:hypothetical protein